MATKNIEININNGNGYDILYPKTMVANIGDLSSNYYNKTEINDLFKNSSNIETGTYKGTGFGDDSSTTITLKQEPKCVLVLGTEMGFKYLQNFSKGTSGSDTETFMGMSGVAFKETPLTWTIMDKNQQSHVLKGIEINGKNVTLFNNAVKIEMVNYTYKYRQYEYAFNNMIIDYYYFAFS